jgi:hypothetical protein
VLSPGDQGHLVPGLVEPSAEDATDGTCSVHHDVHVTYFRATMRARSNGSFDRARCRLCEPRGVEADRDGNTLILVSVLAACLPAHLTNIARNTPRAPGPHASG